MEYTINNLPERPAKPRESGLTMVMDKGLSNQEVENFLSISEPYTDIVKIGFGTAYITPNLKEKLQIYKDAKMPIYFGGTMFEAFIVRDQFDEYLNMINTFDVKYVEVSDGSISISHDKKCDYIKRLTKHATVLSEVGSKDIEQIIPPFKWIELMSKELEAGSWKVIAEARESGNVGIYRNSGEVRSGLVQEILTKIPQENIIWEAPLKAQQVWFIKLLGANVNLGNISPSEVLPLETLRIGLRGDTFSSFLNT